MTKHILFLLMLICCIGWVEGATCLSDLSNMPCNLTQATPVLDAGLDLQCPTDDCFGINESGAYNLNGVILHSNDTDADGAVTFYANNILMSCNGAAFYGNKTTNSRAIYHKYLVGTNITTDGCIFYNYNYGLYLENNQHNALNHRIYGNGSYGTGIYIDTNRNLLNIINITVINTSVGISLQNGVKNSNISKCNIQLSGNALNGGAGVNLTISNNIFNSTSGNAINIGGLFQNSTISNNKIYGNSSSITGSTFKIVNASSVIIKYNNISGSVRGVDLSQSSSNNIDFNNNYVYGSDIGLYLNKVKNSNFTNNIFDNQSNGYDLYSLHNFIAYGNNLRIVNNSYKNTYTTAIFMEATNFSTIQYNNFSYLSLSEKLAINSTSLTNKTLSDLGEAPSAIKIGWFYKTYQTGLDTSCFPNNYNRSCNAQATNNNISILNNTFDGNTIVFLDIQGSTNISHDLTNYWYRNIEPYTTYSANDEYFINNIYDNISLINPAFISDFETNTSINTILDDRLVFGYDISHPRTIVQIKKTDYKVSRSTRDGWGNLATDEILSSAIYNSSTNGVSYIKIKSIQMNITLNETSSSYQLINLSNNATIKNDYAGSKNMLILNNTITINSLPRNMSLFNLSTGTSVFITNLNQNPNYQLTVNSNEQYEIDDCVTPYENITLTTSTTFCAGTYYLNDTEGDGSIKIGGNNVVLDCNGAVLQGNLATNSRGISGGTKTGVIVKNCIINGYKLDIYAGGNNMTVYNNTLLSNTSFGIGVYIDYSTAHQIIYNNFTNTLYGIQTDGATKTVISISINSNLKSIYFVK